MSNCKPCGGNVNYTVPQPTSVQPGGGDAETPTTTPELSACPIHFIEIGEDFEFPAQGETSIIRSCCSEGIAPGAVLYSLGIGYLHVESIPNECEIEVGNHGELCNIKTPGEPVVAGTKLQVGIPVCAGASSDDDCPRLTTDFFVPDYCAAPTDTGGCCRNVGVTSVAGFTEGDRLAYGSREFRLTEIVSPSVIRICNDGAGGLPGAVVLAGECFTVVGGVNICGRDAVDGGQIVVCRDGQQQPMVGTYDGQMPQWNSALERFVLVAAPPLPVCTALDDEFILDSSNPTTTNYVIKVLDSSNFVVNSSININEAGGALRRFKVVTIIDGTTIRVNQQFTPVANITFLTGASVCLIEDVCAKEASAANAVTIGAIVGCVDGISKSVTPSSDSKHLVSYNGAWQEVSMLHGLKVVESTVYTGVGAPVTLNWAALGAPAPISGKVVYALFEIWLSIGGAISPQASVIASVNGTNIFSIDASQVDLSDDENGYRYFRMPVAQGGSVTLRGALNGNASSASVVFHLIGFLA